MYSWPAPPPETFGPLGERGFDGVQRCLGVAAGLADEARGQALVVVEQHLQQVVGRELLVAFAQSKGLRRLNEAASAVRKLFEIHCPSSAYRSALTARPGTFYVRITVASADLAGNGSIVRKPFQQVI